MDPEAAAVARDRNLGGVVYENGDAGIDTAQKFTDVDVEVALRAHFDSIVCQAPFRAPERLGFGDGFGPELGSFGGGVVGEGLDRVGFEAGGKDEGAIGLAGAGVFQEEEWGAGGLFQCFGGEGALPDLKGSRVGGIAGASPGFGGECDGEKKQEAQMAHCRHYTGTE